MARRPKSGDPDQIRLRLIALLEDFEKLLRTGTLRQQVRSLIPVNHVLCDLGRSLMPNDTPSSARDRILAYLKAHFGEVIAGDELMVVAGISEYARRVRELRVQYGWKIASGVTIQRIGADQVAADLGETDIPEMKPSDYLLLEEKPDRDSAYRWKLAHDLRNSPLSVKNRIIRYFQKNVGKPVSGEELSYLAKNAHEWARRVRELRTEDGWPIATRSTGAPKLPVGIYVLQRDRQAPPHDRKITDFVRVAVLKRDDFRCQFELDGSSVCGWNSDDSVSADQRFIELHHKIEHAKGGSNDPENLLTVCNICHDEIHRRLNIEN